ncbi:MAG: hypothetical protein OXE76_12795 [Alphaproteobacteria bacterium]|nr:hypothetical protein [Alphaproteobacteria bacterium]
MDSNGSGAINIRINNRLLARAIACARELGLSRPEFVRRAIERECAETEKLAGRRSRFARNADRDAAQ